MGRAGIPGDIGPMIASLLSGDDRWVNAQRIEVSGGLAIVTEDHAGQIGEHSPTCDTLTSSSARTIREILLSFLGHKSTKGNTAI